MKKKIDPIGPQTKRESKKSDRKSKVLTPMAAPKIKRTIETPASKAAKRKQNIKSVGAAIGVVGATVGTIGAGLYSMYLDKTKPGRNDRKADKARGK